MTKIIDLRGPLVASDGVSNYFFGPADEDGWREISVDSNWALFDHCEVAHLVVGDSMMLDWVDDDGEQMCFITKFKIVSIRQDRPN